MQQDIEIERQFKLLRPASEIIAEAERNGSLLLSYEIHQSYLAYTGNWTVRAHRTNFGGRLTPVFSGRRMTPTFEQTLKCRAEGIARTEVSINLDENGYRRLARQCGPVLWKRRTESCRLRSAICLLASTIRAYSLTSRCSRSAPSMVTRASSACSL